MYITHILDKSHHSGFDFHPWDLPGALANNINPGSFRGGPDASDVVRLVKRHISDGQLSQNPLLVLPHSRISRADWGVNAKSIGWTIFPFRLYFWNTNPLGKRPSFLCVSLRHQNNHSDGFRDQCFQLANAIHSVYGQPYARCVKYLKDHLPISEFNKFLI